MIWHYEPEEHTLHTLNLCSPLHLKGKVSHPYKATGKIAILYILKTADGDTKDSELRSSKHFLNFILKLWMQKWGLRNNLTHRLYNLLNTSLYFAVTQDFNIIF
jgi:hypothetical protein